MESLVLERELDSEIDEIVKCFQDLRLLKPNIITVGQHISSRLEAGGIVYFCGNGGSAADSQHLAAELQGRFLVDRRPLAAIALTTNSSTLTAIGNDYSFDEVFSRQITGLGKKSDVLICLSTSGNSENVILAARAAAALGMLTVALTGISGGALVKECDHMICVPSGETPHIQEMHIAVGHMVCGIVERAL